MQAAPTHRWGLGFIAMRWRHVFWILPLAGLLIGLGLQLWTLYGPTAIGVFQVRPPAAGHSGHHLADLVTVLQSDATLSKTADSLGLCERWASSPRPCVLKLRGMIRIELVPGTSLIDLHVAGPNRKESIEIWKALLAHANQHFLDLRSAAQQAEIVTMEAAIKATKLDLDQKRSELSAAQAQEYLTMGAPHSVEDRKSQADLDRLKGDVEATQKLLEISELQLIANQMGCRLFENPVIVHDSPVLLRSWMNRETLRPLVVQAGTGLSIAVLLTVPVAYLLESLFPRRRQEIHPEA